MAEPPPSVTSEPGVADCTEVPLQAVMNMTAPNIQIHSDRYDMFHRRLPGNRADWSSPAPCPDDRLCLGEPKSAPSVLSITFDESCQSNQHAAEPDPRRTTN
jgi:hypothetical protein